jgi:hypothetical protein
MTRSLYSSTYVFLCLPYVFFLGNWLRPHFAYPAIALLVWSTGIALRGVQRHFGERDASARFGTTPRGVLAVLVPVIAVMCLSGVGGWGYQDADWLRGNAIMVDLVTKPWPVIYQTAPEPLVLVYYVAFYLPAAWIGKIAGWHAANHALFVYGLVGLGLATSWTVRVAGVPRWWAALVFFGFSGMDIVGKSMRHAAEIAAGKDPQTWRTLEWWAGFGVVAFPSHMELVTLTVMQAIPGWLLTALVLNDAREERLTKTGLFYLGVCTLWAPFVCIGLLPLVVVLSLPALRRSRPLRELASWPNALGLVLGLVSAGYYSMRYWPYTLPFDVSHLYQEHFTLTLFRIGPLFLGIYPLFLVLEFGLLHALLYAYVRRRSPALLDTPLCRSLVVSTVGLSILPWINGSWNNDIVLRACLPMLFVTALVALRVLDDGSAPADRRLRLLRAGVLLVIGVGGFNAAWIVGKQVLGTYERGALVAVPDAERVLSPFELQQQRYDKIGFNQVGQYMGSHTSPFAAYVLAHGTPSPP